MRIAISIALLACQTAAIGTPSSQAVASAADQSLAQIAAGTTAGRTYSNPALGLSVDYPDGWQVVPVGKQKETTDRNHQEAFGDSPALQREHEMVERCNRVFLW